MNNSELASKLYDYADYLLEAEGVSPNLGAHRTEKSREVLGLARQAEDPAPLRKLADELTNADSFSAMRALLNAAADALKTGKAPKKEKAPEPKKEATVPAVQVTEDSGSFITKPPAPPSTLRQIGHPDNWYNTEVTSLPVHPQSASWMASLEAYMTTTHSYGRDGSGGAYSMPKLDVNFSAYTGIPAASEQTIGHLVNRITAANQSQITWHEPNNYPGTSDWFTDGAPTYAPAGDYLLIPYHPDFKVQGNGNSHDKHLYVIDEVRGYLFEWYRVENYGDPATLTCGIATYYPLNTVITDRGLGCTSANAAGTPYVPCITTPDDFVQGSIDHAVLLTLPNQPITPLKFLEPCQHTPIQSAGAWPDPPGKTGKFLPYGPRLRLRADFDVEAITGPFASSAKIVLQALKKYGFFHVDGTVGNAQIVCMNDEREATKWHQISGVHPSALWQYNLDQPLSWTDFEVLDATEHTFGQGAAICTRSFVDERGRTTPLTTYP